MQIFLVSIESSMFLVATIAILSSVISTFYYIRIIKTIYFEKIVKWNFYIPVTQVISILMGITFMFVSLLFLNPTIFNLFAYKMAVTCF